MGNEVTAAPWAPQYELGTRLDRVLDSHPLGWRRPGAVSEQRA
jgi:hypothetical protein